VLTVIPMLIIANAYRRSSMRNANCGASFEQPRLSPPPARSTMSGPTRNLDRAR
jgi:hypothetical protein